MGIQINGQTDTITATDGSLSIQGASGNLTGDLTGNVTGNVTGNLTGTASTATAAATAYGLSGSPTLSGITSVSTTNLTVNGNSYPSAGPLSNRNLIINGAMQVAQRGTSFTPATEFGYTLDRYITFFSNTGSANLTQETSSPPEGHTTYARITSTGAASVTGRNLFSQIVEGQNLAPTKWGYSDAKDVTISFWVRSSLTGDFGFAVNDINQNPCIVMKYNIASANTWEHKTLLIPATTSGDFGLTSSGRGCWLFWDLGTSSTHEYGTTDTWVDSSTKYAPTNVQQLITVSGATLDITGVQLEVGSVATPFEHRSYGDELARCQRYYWNVVFGDTETNSTIAQGTNWNGSVGFFTIYPPVSMRTSPSLEVSNTTNQYIAYSAGVGYNISTLTFDGATQPNAIEFSASIGGNQGNAVILRRQNANAILRFFAEL